MLHIVGMGGGGVEDLTLKAWGVLTSGRPMALRGSSHKVAQALIAKGVGFHEVDDGPPQSVARAVLDWSDRLPECVYAMPGHPSAAPEVEFIVQMASGKQSRLFPSPSALDQLPAADSRTLASAGADAFDAGVAFARLVQVMARLRGPAGCPWDAEQTHRSLAIHLLEETHEVLDAIDQDDAPKLAEELGDLLLQIVFHSELARESRRFSPADVVKGLIEKLFQRHPHVFGDASVSGSSEVVKNWEANRRSPARSSALDGIPREMSAMLQAYKVGRRLGEDRPEARQVRLSEGAGEVEIGRFLYEAVGIARRSGIDPEGALRREVGRRATPE